MRDLCIIIVNYRTIHLTRQIVTDCRHYYPSTPLVLVDNNSQDESTQFVQSSDADIVLMNDTNLGHGPALDRAIRAVGNPYILTMDSDCHIIQGGFVEHMMDKFDAPNVYAVGWLRWVNENGVCIGKTEPEPGKHIPYIHPSTAIYRRDIYLTLPPFDYDGAPVNQNMRAAYYGGYAVRDFPIHQYVYHWIAGTRRMYGGRWNPKDNEEPRTWRRNERYPI